MEIIQPSVSMGYIDGVAIMKHLEVCARKAYKSEGKMTQDSYETFLPKIIRSGHESTLEHVSLSVNFIVDRGVSHELVRHRVASFTQESTRYCDYGGQGITVIEPCFFEPDSISYRQWEDACRFADIQYKRLRSYGCTPQEARSVLPNSLKTEIVITANIREWRHIFKLRCHKTAHPQMRQVMIPLFLYFLEAMPILFDDIEYDTEFKYPYAKLIIGSEF